MSGRNKLQFYSPYNFINERAIGDFSATHTKLIKHRFKYAKNLFRKDLKAHFGCVNAIEFSHGSGDWIVSGGDDRRILLWNVQKAFDNFGPPKRMKGEHHSNIFCLAFDNTNKKIYSGGNDEQVIVHDAYTGETLDVFLHNDAVYGLSADPVNSDIFASACDDGRVLIYDTRTPADEDPFCLANYTSPMHAVMFNPAEPRLVATANSREGLGLWDVRKPKSCLIRYGGSLCRQSCMSVRISKNGDKVLGLRRRLPPVVYNIHCAQTLHQFDHSGYYNSCTMKSCCFAGDKDQYIISGSDDFNLYVWKIPEEGCEDWVGKAHLVLHGHRSIVNQVRFNPENHVIISSGVEKVVKAWSPFPLHNGSGDLGLSPETDEREVYTHEQYINLVLRSGQLMTHDYSLESTDEDPRMMAFFDSLVQRELEGWSSEDSFSSRSPIRDSYVQSDSSPLASPNVTVDHIHSVAADAVLRFFSPINAITNRNTSSLNAANDSNVTDQQSRIAGNENSTNTNNGVRTILDMDQQPPSVIPDLVSSTPNVESVQTLPMSNDNSLTDNHHVQPNSVDTSLQNENEATTVPSSSDVSNVNNHDATTNPVQLVYSVEPDTPSTSGIDPDVNSRAASYKSISELIRQKRKDYLAGIKKLEKRATRRKIRFLSRRKDKLKRIRHRLLSSIESRDSTDSDSESNSKQEYSLSSVDDGIVSSTESSCSVSSSSASSSESESQINEGLSIVNEIAEKNKQRLNRIQKFKNLRKKALNDSSDENECSANNINTKTPSGSCDASKIGSIGLHFPSRLNSNSGASSCVPFPVYEDISNDSCSVNEFPSVQNAGESVIENKISEFVEKTDHCKHSVNEKDKSNNHLSKSNCATDAFTLCVPHVAFSSDFLSGDSVIPKHEKGLLECNNPPSGDVIKSVDLSFTSLKSNLETEKSSLPAISTSEQTFGNDTNSINTFAENEISQESEKIALFKKRTEKNIVKKRNYRKKGSDQSE